LALHLYELEKDKANIPTATSAKEIELDDNQTTVMIEV
jgi:hypothetical protein